MSKVDDITETRHKTACRNECMTYVDPETGYHVFTAFYLAQRGFCCSSGCRHCPYDAVDTNRVVDEELLAMNRSRTLSKNWKRDRR